jgi:hypothetical protein
MGGHENRQLTLALDLLEHFPHIDAGNRIKAGGGFIQKKNLWTVDKPTRLNPVSQRTNIYY